MEEEILNCIAEHGYNKELFVPKFIDKWKGWDVYFCGFKDDTIIWGIPPLVLVNGHNMRMATVREVEKFEDYEADKYWAGKDDKLFDFLNAKGYDRDNYNVEFLCYYLGWNWFHIRKIEMKPVWHFPVIVKAQKDRYEFASKKRIHALNKHLKRENKKVKAYEKKARVKCSEFDPSISPKLFLTQEAYMKAVEKAEKIMAKMDKQLSENIK